MITDKDIEEFYEHFKKLGLKKPVAAISKATGYGMPNVSQYLSGKLVPSEAFLNAYYNSFPKNAKIVSHEIRQDEATPLGTNLTWKYLMLLEEENARIKKRQSESLEEMRTILLMNQAILKTLRKAVAQLISKSEKSDLLEVAHRLDKETSEVFQKLSGKDSFLFDK